MFSNIKNPLVKNASSSFGFTSIKKTDQVASNNMDFNDIDIRASEKELECPELVNGVESRVCENHAERSCFGDNLISSEALTKNDADMFDDSIIPPTPSPVDGFKIASRLSLHKNKRMQQSAGHFPNKEQRNYKHIKKPSISRNHLDHSKFIAKRTQNSKCNENLNISESVKENLLSINGKDKSDSNMTEDFTNWSDKVKIPNSVVKDDGGKSIRNSSLKLSRKTFKLSKKPKRSETGSKPTDKTLECGDEGCDILSGYGTQGKAVDYGLLHKVRDGTNDESRSLVRIAFQLYNAEILRIFVFDYFKSFRIFQINKQ